MRWQVRALVAATTLLVLVAFLVPLAFLVRTVAADRAVNAATRDAESVAPIVLHVDRSTLRVTLQQMAGDDAEDYPVTVFFPDGTRIGSPAPRSDAVSLARSGRSVTANAEGGREVLVAVQGDSAGTTVVRVFVSDQQLRQGVARTWVILVLLGVSLLALSLLVADRLARSIVRPVTALARVTRRLAGGDQDARADATDGPPEVRSVAAGLNRLADRIGELLAAERESAADLSHQLRTPLTALRLSIDSVPDQESRTRLGAQGDVVERTVDRIIAEARRPVREGVTASCDATAVVADRLDFWSALAEEEEREVTSGILDSPAWVKTTAGDLTVAVDALLGNVFAHTPPGTPFAVRLDRRDGGGGTLTVADDGPGMREEHTAVERGSSEHGSTGLGLDIVTRTATSSGGGVQVGRSPAGGAQVVVELAAPPPVPET